MASFYPKAYSKDSPIVFLHGSNYLTTAREEQGGKRDHLDQIQGTVVVV